jgi:hypothetical protein
MATPLADLALLSASLTPAEFRWRATGTAAREDAGDGGAQAALLERHQAAEAAGELESDAQWPALACAVRLCAEPDAWLLAEWEPSSGTAASTEAAPAPRTVISAPDAARDESLSLEKVLREREAERENEGEGVGRHLLW